MAEPLAIGTPRPQLTEVEGAAKAPVTGTSDVRESDGEFLAADAPGGTVSLGDAVAPATPDTIDPQTFEMAPVTEIQVNDDIVTGVHESKPVQPLDKETYDLIARTGVDPAFADENQITVAVGKPHPRKKKSFTEEDFKKNDLVHQAVKILMPLFSGIDPTAESDGDGADTLDEAGLPPKLLEDMSKEELGEWALDFMGWFNYNLPNMAYNTNRLRSGDNRQKMAMYYLMEMYDDKEMSWDGVWRGVRGILADPTTYVGLSTLGIGTVVGASVKAASKTSVKAALKASLGPILAGSAEAGVYTGTDDALRQAVSIMAGAQEGYDPVRGAVATVIGTVAGGGLTAGMSSAVPLARKGAQAFEDTVQNAMRGDTLTMGVGPTGKPGPTTNAIPPSKPAPTPEELTAARADTRQGADIVGNRLDTIVPESERVAGGTYTPGQPDGRQWSALTPDELSVRGSGFKGNDKTLQKAWEDTLSEVSEAARDAVARTGATWEAFKAADWDKALKLPLRSQLWYELSGEKFKTNLPQLSHDEHMMFLDLIGATSARAKPGENLERALAVLSQRVRGVPVDVDVTIPATVSDALRRGGNAVSSDLANKTGMFSDTLALTAGIPVRYPISVNDVWVGKAFGISDAEMSGNQALHEVFGKYMNKVRDSVNGGIGHNSGDVPHQSWHLQARQWVQMRAADEGIDTSAGKTIDGSDYAGEWAGVVDKLEAAGISVPNGVITRNILGDPRFADALRQTTPAFRDAPKATVEFGTLLTPSGKRAAEIHGIAKQAGDKKTADEYTKILTTSMYATGRGKPTPWQNLVRVATGGSDSVTRIYSPVSTDPFAISGSFEGSVGPNIRVPLKDMTPDQIAYFNAVVGEGLKQKAMAAAQIKRIGTTTPLGADEVETASIRFDWQGNVPEKMITDISDALGDGFEVSVMRYPDGVVVDVNPRFGDNGAEGPTTEQVDNAIDLVVDSYGAKNPKSFRTAFKSEYGKNYVEDPGDGSEYKRIIKETVKGWKDVETGRVAELTDGLVKPSDIRKFLNDPDGKLPITQRQLDEKRYSEANPGADAPTSTELKSWVEGPGGAGVQVSSVRGRASTIRKQLRQRISDHDEQRKSWAAIGAGIDKKMGAAIPKWEKRMAKAAKDTK